jgi:hypothetical protein
MRVNPMITDAGPPETKELAEPMNRPEPIAPPLQRMLENQGILVIEMYLAGLTWQSSAYGGLSSPS